MPTTLTTTTPSPNGRAAGTPTPTAHRVGIRPRRQVPWMVAGVVLVVGFALAFATVSVHLGGSQQMLVTARSVQAGHRLTAADLRSVQLSGPGAAGWLPATAQANVLGRTTAVPLVAGAPLTTAELGSASALSAGTDVVAVALKAGQYPPTLAPGDRVAVVATGPAAEASPTAGAATSGSAPPVAATVTGVDTATASTGGVTVVSLQVSDADATGLARLGAAGQVALVLRPPGAGG